MFRKLALFMALGAGVSLPLANLAEAAVADDIVIGSHIQVLPVEKAQFFFGGRNYCWYDNGWQGPGFYWCGYAFRTGLGWGGGAGWHGWRRGGGGGRPRRRPRWRAEVGRAEATVGAAVGRAEAMVGAAVGRAEAMAGAELGRAEAMAGAATSPD